MEQLNSVEKAIKSLYMHPREAQAELSALRAFLYWTRTRAY